MYELTGDKACQACAAGYYSTGGTSSCQAYGGSCDNGQMQDQQNLRTRENQCKSCDAMYELTGDKACQAIGFDVGVEVRVKASVVTPRYHWGTVTHSSIGEVITIADNYIVVKFPEFPSWKADPSEMELVNEACNEAISPSDSGRSYRGCQTKTRSGKTCQRWDSNTPHTVTHQFANADSDYCRNFDHDTGDTIWCYTTDPASRWEYCDPI